MENKDGAPSHKPKQDFERTFEEMDREMQELESTSTNSGKIISIQKLSAFKPQISDESMRSNASSKKNNSQSDALASIQLTLTNFINGSS